MCSSGSPRWLRNTFLTTELTPPSSRFVVRATGPPAASAGPGKAKSFPSRKSFSNRRQQRRSSSYARHWKARTSPLSPSMAMIRRQPWPMYVPSAMTVWRFASGGAMRGRIDQHHAIRLRRARASPMDSDAVWDDGPGSHERNSSSVRARLRPRCGIVELSRQARHLHRCVPLPVRPFFFIARPHAGHFFALLDGVLTPSSPPPGAHHFPRGGGEKKTCRRAHSYKARPRS